VAVATTTGLLSRLSSGQLNSLMAHKITHIKNCNPSIMKINAGMGLFGGKFDNSSDRYKLLGKFGTILIALLAPFTMILTQWR
jgi:hypothetical protein